MYVKKKKEKIIRKGGFQSEGVGALTLLDMWCGLCRDCDCWTGEFFGIMKRIIYLISLWNDTT